MSQRAGAKDEGILTSSTLSSELSKTRKKSAAKTKTSAKTAKATSKKGAGRPVHAILYVPKGAELDEDEMTIQVVSINDASFASMAMRRT